MKDLIFTHPKGCPRIGHCKGEEVDLQLQEVQEACLRNIAHNSTQAGHLHDTAVDPDLALEVCTGGGAHQHRQQRGLASS